MKYSNALYALLVCLFTTFSFSAYSQCGVDCYVACNGQINVSLGVGCETIFTPDMGGKNISSANIQCYTAEVFDHYDKVIPGGVLTLNNLNQLLTYKVTEVECGNYCWGTVLVEYKLGPQIVCPEDMTISCNALEELELPVPDDLCAAVTMSMISEKFINLDCDVDHQSQVIRTYSAVDEFGNSASCSHNIFLRRLPLNEIIFPDKTIISCNDPHVQYDADGFPIPWFYQALEDTSSQYGVPFLCQDEMTTLYNCPTSGIYATNNSTGSGTGSYNYPGLGPDSGFYGVPLFPDAGGIITVETGDSLAPFKTTIIDDPRTSLYCGAAVVYTDREIPNAKNPCKRKIFRTWQVLEWWCSDELSATAVQIIEIINDQSPTMVCPPDQTVNSNTDCFAEINLPPAHVQDHCSLEFGMTMNYANEVHEGNGGWIKLHPGQSTLTYLASDGCGNESSCEVNFTVIDYSTPIALCEDGKIVSLASGEFTRVPAHVFDDGSYDDCSIEKIEVRRIDTTCHELAADWSEYAYFCCADASLDEVLLEFKVTDASGNFGACEARIVVQDKAIPIVNCPPNVTVDCHLVYDPDNMGPVFGFGSVSDNCVDSEPHEVIDGAFDQCGIGVMIRRMQALDIDGNVLSSCDQQITIVNEDPFTREDIIWPEDFVAFDQCGIDGLDPESLEGVHAYPDFDRSKCAVLGYEYEDEVFTYNSQAGDCAIINRTWTVINWCSGDGSEFELFTNPVPQILRVQNTIAPVLDEGFDLLFETVNDCNNGSVDVTRTATDDCDNQFRWEYVITEFGKLDTIGFGISNHFEGKFPVGSYNIYWTVRDICGNAAYHTQFMQVVSKKAPTPVCHNSIAASLGGIDLDGNGTVDDHQVALWASDFDAGSYPACNTALAYSLSSDITDRNIVFTCDDVGVQRVEMWVTDLVTNAQDFCIATIEIQDPGVCFGGGLRATVAGNVHTEDEKEVEGVQVNIDDSLMALTNDEGNYAFADMPLGGAYSVAPTLDENYLNGVSTLDLILIQRHILGIDYLDSPYKLIAADVNGSRNINGIDLVELRKLILGIYTELPDNSSWRFVSDEYSFIDNKNPWIEQWEEQYPIASLTADMSIDFIGVKIGDVNNSVAELGNDRLDIRSANAIIFDQSIPALDKDEIGSLVITAKNYHDILGWQATFGFDPNLVEVLAVQSKAIELDTEQHCNFSQIESGLVTVSYNNIKSETIAKGEVILEFVVKAKKTIPANAQLIKLSSEQVRAEAYSSTLARIPLHLEGAAPYLTAPKILSVNPNPWISRATMVVEMPAAADVAFDFYDVNGRKVYQMERSLESGFNSIAMTRGDLDTKGILIVRLTSMGMSSEYRMIVY